MANYIRDYSRQHGNIFFECKKFWLLLASGIWGLIFLSSVSLAEIFKWTDEAGVIHYSHQPPVSNISHFDEVSKQLTYVHILPAVEAVGVEINSEEADKKIKRTRVTESKGTELEIRKKTNKNSVSASHLQADKQRDQCQHFAKQLQDIQYLLRSGYSEPRGNRLRERRRNISELVRNRCPKRL